MRIIPYEARYRDDMIFMVLQAKDALGRVPGLNEDLLDVPGNYLEKGDGFWLALDEGDRVIGCVGYRSIPGTTQVRLHRLYVKAALKRRGIGTALLQTAEGAILARGKTAIHVHLGGKEYFESRRFYPKHGYAEYAPDYMKKELKGERWDLYDRDRRLTGRAHIRGVPVPDGSYHLVVNVWLRNSRGEYLISQRSADRRDYPLYWECVGGSALMGEDSLTAALRETKEEVGVDLEPGGGRLVFTETGRVFRGERFHDILDVWQWEYDGPVALEKATTREVARTAWMTREQIRDLYEGGALVPTLGYFFERREAFEP